MIKCYVRLIQSPWYCCLMFLTSESIQRRIETFYWPVQSLWSCPVNSRWNLARLTFLCATLFDENMKNHSGLMGCSSANTNMKATEKKCRRNKDKINIKIIINDIQMVSKVQNLYSRYTAISNNVLWYDTSIFY